MSIKRALRLLIPAIIFTAPLSQAQDKSLENWYQVEVIFFTQEDLYHQEGFPQNPELTYPKRLEFLNTAEQLFQDIPANAGYTETLAALMVPEKFLTRKRALQPGRFVPLEKNRRNLNPDAFTLDRDSRYRVLFHNAWQQPVNGSGSAPWVYISGGKSYGNHRELEGSLRIYRSRFLNIQFDLWLSTFASAAPTANTTQAANTPPPLLLPDPPETRPSRNLQRLRMMDSVESAGASAGAPPTAFDRYTVSTVDVLKSRQQVSVKSPVYIDHPRMGALVLVTPLAGGEDEEANAD